MSHLGAYFWLRLKKATYELDGLLESSLLYHYHQHSPRRCDRSLPRQKAGLSWVLYHGIVVDQRNTLQPLEDLSGSVVVVHRWLFHILQSRDFGCLFIKDFPHVGSCFENQLLGSIRRFCVYCV